MLGMLDLDLSSNMLCWISSWALTLFASTRCDFELSTTRPERLEGSRDLVLELQLAHLGGLDGVPFANLPFCQRLFLKAAAQIQTSSHQDVGWLDVAVHTASFVYEVEPVENGVQDVARAALCEGGLLKELAHVALVQVEHEADVPVPSPLGL